MGQCESCVNTSKTAKGGEKLSYQKGKKRHSKAAGGSRRNSISTGSDYTGSKSTHTPIDQIFFFRRCRDRRINLSKVSCLKE